MQGKGVLCHLTSLPEVSLNGALRFLQWLEQRGYTAWQMLPLTPPDKYGSSYASPSAFAAWPELMQSDEAQDMEEDEAWLEDWALYAAIKEDHGHQPWFTWPLPLRNRHPEALETYREAASVHRRQQQRFMAAWRQLAFKAKEAGISLVGDIPIFIAHDSADVWAHRTLFQLDENGWPTHVAGVPPDYFSEGGQKWGTVLYDWEAHRSEEWSWWKQRMERMFRLFDVVRIDHFRGLHSNWAVPVDDEDARRGFWQEGPGDELLEVLLPLAQGRGEILAEDLGIIPPKVIELRKRHQLCGMAVMHFGFHGEPENNPHHPHSIQSDQVVYTGTHDNNTTLWWRYELDDEVKTRIQSLLKPNEEPVDGMMRLAVESDARLAIFPLQDLLGLDESARINTPGPSEHNWNWQCTWQDLDELKNAPP